MRTDEELKKIAEEVGISEIGTCFLYEDTGSEGFIKTNQCTNGLIRLTKEDLLVFPFEEPNKGTVVKETYMKPYLGNIFNYKHEFIDNEEAVRKIFINHAKRFKVLEQLSFGMHPVFSWVKDKLIEDKKGDLEGDAKYFFASTKDWAGLAIEKDGVTTTEEVYSANDKERSFENLMSRMKK